MESCMQQILCESSYLLLWPATALKAIQLFDAIVYG